MLKYAKEILQKVSFDRQLFEKELRKAIKTLIPAELEDLKTWCLEKFGHLYHAIIKRSFALAKA
ncbi:MAG TPA: hypothetical protein DDY13_19020 [Cytophagales bacterium]|jgi:lantibiotic modifying enzyme|nr:hypothetical protein [Cytophagales bacterium]